jgi:hypothetical protein
LILFASLMRTVRHGFLGTSDVPIGIALGVTAVRPR